MKPTVILSALLLTFVLALPAGASTASVKMEDVCDTDPTVTTGDHELLPSQVDICAGELTASYAADGTLQLDASLTVAGGLDEGVPTSHTLGWEIDGCAVFIQVRDEAPTDGMSRSVMQYDCEQEGQFASFSNLSPDTCAEVPGTTGTYRCYGSDGSWVALPDDVVTVTDDTISVTLRPADVLPEEAARAYAAGTSLGEYTVTGSLRAGTYSDRLSRPGRTCAGGYCQNDPWIADDVSTSEVLLIPVDGR